MYCTLNIEGRFSSLTLVSFLFTLTKLRRPCLVIRNYKYQIVEQVRLLNSVADEWTDSVLEDPTASKNLLPNVLRGLCTKHYAIYLYTEKSIILFVLSSDSLIITSH